MNKPKVSLIGNDGNGFGIIATCIKAARKAGWSKDKICEYQNEAMAGDYDHLLQTTLQYFEVK